MVKLQEFMERMGIRNQRELAKLLGITQAAISSWNSGTRAPTYEMCIRLRRMGMTEEELFGEKFTDAVQPTERKNPEKDFDDRVRLSLVNLLENLYSKK